MEMYCWGNTSHGQLGLGGIEAEQVRAEQQHDKQETSELMCVYLFRY